MPQPETAAAEVASRPGNMLIGVRVRDPDPQLKEQFNFDPDAELEGVFVTEVARFGPASSAGLGPGWLIQRVNGKAIRSVEDFDSVLGTVKPGDVVSLDAVAATRDGNLVHRIINVEVPKI